MISLFLLFPFPSLHLDSHLSYLLAPQGPRKNAQKDSSPNVPNAKGKKDFARAVLTPGVSVRTTVPQTTTSPPEPTSRSVKTRKLARGKMENARLAQVKAANAKRKISVHPEKIHYNAPTPLAAVQPTVLWCLDARVDRTAKTKTADATNPSMVLSLTGR